MQAIIAPARDLRALTRQGTHASFSTGQCSMRRVALIAADQAEQTTKQSKDVIGGLTQPCCDCGC
jgi:hypothetical protein